MPKKSAAHMKKVNEAVRILGTTTGLNVLQAMILAGFPKKDTTNETVRRMIWGVAMAVDEAEDIVAARGDDDVGDGNVGVGNVGVGGGGGEGYHEYESEMRARMDKGGLPYAILNNQLLKAMTMQTKTAYDVSARRQR
jgi:hypothetical protein